MDLVKLSLFDAKSIYPHGIFSIVPLSYPIDPRLLLCIHLSGTTYVSHQRP